MSDIICSVSVPGIVHLFGEYGSVFGEPGVAFTIDQRLSIEAKLAEYDFHVVDGYKLDPKRHSIFQKAIERIKTDQYLEFTTSSQLPLITGLGTNTALTLGITRLLLEIRRKKKAELDQKMIKKQYTKSYIIKTASIIESSQVELSSPLGPAAGLLGGVVFNDDEKEDSLWSMNYKNSKGNKIIQYIHSLQGLSDIPLVIGFLNHGNFNKSIFEDPSPLFDEPVVSKPRKKVKSHSSKQKSKSHEVEPITYKLQRLVSKSGFAKDNLIEMGNLVSESFKPILVGDVNKIGNLMQKHENALIMIGVFNPKLRDISEAAKKESYGVSLIGLNGDAVLALPKDSKTVAENIEDAGGVALTTNLSKIGLIIEIK